MWSSRPPRARSSRAHPPVATCGDACAAGAPVRRAFARRLRALARIAAIAAVWSSLLCAAPSRAEWVVGRTPEVFDPESDAIATRVGGWFDLSYEDNDLDTSTRSINVNHLNVFVDTRYRDTWQIFFEGELENESDLTGFEAEREYEIEQLYARYRHASGLEVRAGKFNTPFGYWTPLHWSILMETIRAPIHEDQRITPEQQHGLSIVGRVPLGGGASDLRYTTYVGYGNDSEPLEETRSDGVSAGADLRFEMSEDRFLGLSYYQQQREGDAGGDRSERSLALYGQLPLTRSVLVRGEYIRQTRDGDARPAFEREVNILYGNVRWNVGARIYLNYRFNFGDNDDEIATSTRYAHTFTYGVDISPSLRLKLEYADHRFRDSARRDFRYWGVSVGAFY
jgi:hypothetical protein